MSKFIVANLASALVLMAASAVFAAADPTPSSPPTDQASAPAAQSPASTTPAVPAAQPTAAKVAKKPSPSDIICKPDTGTGSRVGGAKICMTRAEWKQRDTY